MRRCRALLMVLALWPARAAAGAWTLPADHVQLLSSATYSVASGGYDAHSQLTLPASYRKLLVQIHGEYGLRDWLTLIVAPDFASASLATPASPLQTANDFAVETGVRARLSESAGEISLQVTAKSSGAFDTNVSVNGAPGQQIDLRLLYGRSFQMFGLQAFADAEMAQRFSLGRRADEVPIDLTFGVESGPRTKLLLQSFNLFAEGNAQSPYGYFRLHKLSFSIIRKLTDRLSVEMGSYATVAGQNALAERGAMFRLWVEI